MIQKYGGTSVGSPERIRAVANRIIETRQKGHELVVVVSAMGQTTDELIALAHRISADPPHREMDMLLTVGERISMALLSMALADLGVPAVSLTGSQTGIITDGSHRRARIRRILGDRVRNALGDGKVVIVAGFQGVSEDREITTLGRGGSDTSAVALAAALKAESCEIYTDVDGVFTADPRVVPSARRWSRIPHDLMVELASRGAGVLHPRSIELARQCKIALKVRNSFGNESEGTEVIGRGSTTGLEEFGIAGVTADREKALITIKLMRPTALGAVWDMAAAAHLSVIAPIFSDGKVFLFAEREAVGEWKRRMEQLAVDGFVGEFQIDESVVPVSVVGDRFSQDGGALSEMTGTLAQAGIFPTVVSASTLAVTFAVSESRADEAVQALHARFLNPEGERNFK